MFSNIKEACYPTDAAGNVAPGVSGHLDTTVFEDVFTTGKFKGEDYVVKSAYIHCSNPLVTMCNNDYTSRWIDALEFVVGCRHVHDRNMQACRHCAACRPLV